MAGEGYGVGLGVHRHVGVVGDERVAVESILDQQRDVEWIGVPGDVDIV